MNNAVKRITVTLAIVAVLSVSAQGQNFSNLNFESAYDLPANPSNGVYIPAANAFPDWALGGSEVSVFYESNFLGDAGVSAVQLEGGALALDGDFSLRLNDGGSISQTGLVPANAESLDFEATSTLNLDVTLGGQRLSYSALYDGPNYIEYGANIATGLDGQMEELTFSNLGLDGSTLLDNIQFSPSATPEPGEMALIGLGAVLFYMSIHMRQRRKQRLRP